MVKPFLVVARVGDNSLHPAWLEGNPHFDIYISYFGDELDRYKDHATYYEQRKGGKWPIIGELLEREAPLVEKYDAIWFPDDDLLADAATVNRMFALFVGFDLQYAQPALTQDSYFTYPYLLQSKSSVIRYINFVEVMAPIFSQKALCEIKETITVSPSGWGLDFLWSKIFSKSGADKVAVIDAAPVKHTRPVGGELYTKNPELSPKNDWKKVEALFSELNLDANLKENKVHVNGVVCTHLTTNRFIARQVGKHFRKKGLKLGRKD